MLNLTSGFYEDTAVTDVLAKPVAKCMKCGKEIFEGEEFVRNGNILSKKYQCLCPKCILEFSCAELFNYLVSEFGMPKHAAILNIFGFEWEVM